MNEAMEYSPETEISKSEKPYWETGIDAHKWANDENKTKRLRPMANKIHFLVEKGIVEQYLPKEKGGYNYESELYEALGKNEQGFKSDAKYSKINQYIDSLDELQSIIFNRKKMPDYFVKTTYSDFSQLINDLKIYEHSNIKSQRDEIDEKLKHLSEEAAIYENASEVRGMKKAA